MNRLAASLLVLALVAIIGVGQFFDYAFREFTPESRVAETGDLRQLQKLGAGLASAINLMPDKQAFVKSWNSSASEYSIEIVPLAEFAIAEPLLRQLRAGRPLPLEGDTGRFINFHLAATDELLVIKVPPLDDGEPPLRSRMVFTVLFYLVIVASFLGWIALLTRQLLVLRHCAIAFGQGDLGRRLHSKRYSLIGDIETAFNSMAQRIEGLIGDMKLLTAAISHEMRGPLARVRFGLDALQEEQDPVRRREYEQRIGATVDELSNLVDALLHYARLDYALSDTGQRPVFIAEVITWSIDKLAVDRPRVVLECHNLAAQVRGDEFYLGLLMDNILSNAIRFAKSEVKVTVEQTATGVTLAVTDDGPGIAAEQCQKVLLPFVRERNQAAGAPDGFGLGLAIVHRIAQWLGAELVISKSSVLGGAQITVHFPA